MPLSLSLKRFWPFGTSSGRRSGVHIQRLGGRPVWTPAANLPRVAEVLAVRCLVIFPRPRAALILRMDGRFLRRVALPPPTPMSDGRGRQTCNVWLDLSDLPLGTHRITVEPSGPWAWLYRRGRKFVRTDDGLVPASDASLPPGLGPDLEAAVAALPSVVRPTRRSLLAGPVRSILVARADHLGDLAVSMPAIARLRQLFPDARLTLLATAGNAYFAHATGLFDEIVPIVFDHDASGPQLLPEPDQSELTERLRAGRFDIALDLGEGPRSRGLLRLAGAAFTYGFRYGDHGWLSASFTLNAPDPLNTLETIPPSRKLLALVEALGAATGAPPPPLPLTADPALLARHGLAPGERYILLHGGARLAYSRWPHMSALLHLLLARTDLPVVMFVDRPDDAPIDLPPPERRRVRVIDGLIPFAEFDALLASAAVMVGNDSGPKHLAAVRGTKVVSLHTARLNWNEWGQEGEGLIVSRRLPCAGCGIGPDPAECGRDFQCLTGITAEEAGEAVLSLL